MSGRWQHSTRRATLPDDWPALRRAVLVRDAWQCQIADPQRCTGHATDVDHIGRSEDHSLANLRAACRPCHARRSAMQGAAARAVSRAAARYPVERGHPGLL